jgi:hypothetical protein
MPARSGRDFDQIIDPRAKEENNGQSP